MDTTLVVILVVACLLAGAGIGAWLVSLRPQPAPQPNNANALTPTVGDRLVAEAAGTKAVRLAHGAPAPPNAGGESLVEGGLFRLLPGGGFEWQEYKPARIEVESAGERIDRLERDFLATQPQPTPETQAPASTVVTVETAGAQADSASASLAEQTAAIVAAVKEVLAAANPASTTPAPATEPAPPPLLTIVPAGTEPAEGPAPT
ncbi:MAG: hypothetical protein CEN89_28 [Candidatus Berkelbacteria bacterium Licking1014_7]|uniref:Uncharacterized protein n=1 Tax=Candidatus Berkelbacteria bacterium Licking1014_7 TaxID=2017147 RepID=A0A554LKU5_9BACT|nr:MAG: hypothetical protein CEN89_28 [Candidatus Berkelbacteria bacterium Licking1014_7]